jgi:sporulation protein YlmC with PRC-barrel domain
MASENMIARVRKGMEVHTTDGQSLGKVTDVWVGTDPTATNPLCDEELCSRLEVQQGGLFKRKTLYVPYSAVANVSADQVLLNIDAATVQERPWNQKPRWVEA